MKCVVFLYVSVWLFELVIYTHGSSCYNMPTSPVMADIFESTKTSPMGYIQCLRYCKERVYCKSVTYDRVHLSCNVHTLSIYTKPSTGVSHFTSKKNIVLEKNPCGNFTCLSRYVCVTSSTSRKHCRFDKNIGFVYNAKVQLQNIGTTYCISTDSKGAGCDETKFSNTWNIAKASTCTTHCYYLKHYQSNKYLCLDASLKGIMINPTVADGCLYRVLKAFNHGFRLQNNRGSYCIASGCTNTDGEACGISCSGLTTTWDFLYP